MVQQTQEQYSKVENLQGKQQSSPLHSEEATTENIPTNNRKRQRLRRQTKSNPNIDQKEDETQQ